MDKELKQKIDDIWRETYYGQICFARSREDHEKAEHIKQSAFEAGYLCLAMMERELAEKIAALLSDVSQVDEYLMLLDKEDRKLGYIMIRYDLFSEVEECLRKQRKDL